MTHKARSVAAETLNDELSILQDAKQALLEATGMTSTQAGDALFGDPKHLLAKAEDKTSYVHALDRRYGKLMEMEGSASIA